MSSTLPSEYVVPTPRVDSLPDAAPRLYKAMATLAASVKLDPQLRDLINVRVSQLNGCAFCLDMHVREARERGEREQRLDTLAGWRESPFFTARERAALALAEAVTRLVDGPVPDAVYDAAAAHFDEPELMELLYAITVINSWNRLAVTVKMTAGQG